MGKIIPIDDFTGYEDLIKLCSYKRNHLGYNTGKCPSLTAQARLKQVLTILP